MQIDLDLNYYIGTFRRSRFDTSVMPQCLNMSSSAHLSGFDSDNGNLFKFSMIERGKFVLEIVGTGKQAMYVSKTLKTTTRKEDAAVWDIEEYPETFRGGPMDICVQFFMNGKVLCSREKTGQVMLMDLKEAETMKDKNSGDFAINIAWELTPDCDEAIGGGDIASMPEWLRDMLVAS